jgi:hypothetical protein
MNILITSEKHENKIITTIEPMPTIQSIDIIYNNQKLYVQYMKENDGELKILTVNKAPRYIPRIQELINEIKEIVSEQIAKKEYKDEQICEEEGGWASEVSPHESDWEL